MKCKNMERKKLPSTSHYSLLTNSTWRINWLTHQNREQINALPVHEGKKSFSVLQCWKISLSHSCLLWLHSHGSTPPITFFWLAVDPASHPVVRLILCLKLGWHTMHRIFPPILTQYSENVWNSADCGLLSQDCQYDSQQLGIWNYII